jgi:hypothetical protein
MTCDDCSGLFVFLPRGVCVACQEAREERYQQVRDWLVGRPHATMLDLTEAFDIDEALVAQWIREGRLRAIPLSPDAAARARVQQLLRARFDGRTAGAFDPHDPPGMMRSKTQ